MSDLNFVIFKLGRSGSSALSLALDQAEGCCCISEILNDLSDKEVDPSYFQSFIDERIRSITEASKIGFTLNPFKSPKIEHGFWKFPKSHTKIVFNLTRDAFEQTVSAWVSRKTQSWPGSRRNSVQLKREIAKIEEFLNNGYEIPEEEIFTLLQKTRAETQKLKEFSKAFAEINKAEFIEIDYRKIYQPPHSDIKTIEKKLDLRLGRSFLDPSLKVLPDYLLKKISNFERLKEKA